MILPRSGWARLLSFTAEMINPMIKPNSAQPIAFIPWTFALKSAIPGAYVSPQPTICFVGNVLKRKFGQLAKTTSAKSIRAITSTNLPFPPCPIAAKNIAKNGKKHDAPTKIPAKKRIIRAFDLNIFIALSFFWFEFDEVGVIHPLCND
jgi:hypothetical protein